MKLMRNKVILPKLLVGIILSISGCASKPIAEEHYQKTDTLIEQISDNLRQSPELTEEIKIDHSRLASAAGQPFYPTQVIIFNNERLEAKMIHQNQILALELPLKILAYKSESNKKSTIIWNDISYISNRYNTLFSDDITKQYNQSIQSAIKGIPQEKITSFSTNAMVKSGIITLHSEQSFDETFDKALEIIKSNDDVVVFDEINFQERARNQDIKIGKTKLIMYGAPNPGGKSMGDAQTLGLDAFPQKFLVWQDANGVHVSYNKLSIMADRQNANKSIALRVIQYRVNSAFESAFH